MNQDWLIFFIIMFFIWGCVSTGYLIYYMEQSRGNKTKHCSKPPNEFSVDHGKTVDRNNILKECGDNSMCTFSANTLWFA